MHEMSSLIRIVNLASESAKAQGVPENGLRVSEIRLQVGALTGLLTDYLIKYYPEASKGTLLEGSVLNVEEVPVETECLGCGGHYNPNKQNDYRCPCCRSTKGRIVGGRDTVLKQIVLK